MPSGAQRYEPDHGTEARYNRGCKCARCKAARAEAVRERKQRREAAQQSQVTSIDAAPSAPGPMTGVAGSVQKLIALVADDPVTQVRAAMALELAKRLDKGDGAPAPIAAQLQVLMAGLKPVKQGVVADGVSAPRLSALFGTRGRVDPGAVPGSDGAAAVGDS